MLKIFIRPEIFVYFAIVFSAVLFFVLATLNNGLTQSYGELMNHYLRNLSRARLFEIVSLLIIALFARGLAWWIHAVLRGIEPATVFRVERIKAFFPLLRSFAKNAVTIGIPAVIAFYGTGATLSQMNIFNEARLRDDLLFRFDVLTTGTFPPLTAGSLSYPSWFIEAVDFSFMHLVWVLLIFGAYLFIARQRLFREMAGALFLGFMLLFVGWLWFPVLSPHDRFIDNVYNLPVAPVVQQYIETYQPQQEIQTFLEQIREDKADLEVFPTSTFPSAHVAWATLLVYYAWRVKAWLGVVAFPFALLSSLGTFLFAQHYFVDFPAGVLVSVISIWIAYWFAKKQYGASARFSATS